MNVQNDYAVALENAKLVAEAARKKAQEAKVNAEKEQAEAQQANAAINEANNSVANQQSIYTGASSTLDAKKAEYSSALKELEVANASGDENAIATAQANLQRIEQELAQIESNVQQEYNELLKLQQDVQTAITRAEIEQKEAADSLKELEIAEKELIEAEEALKQAEEAAATAAAEEAKLAEGVNQLTEEMAIERGYTIIKTVEDLQAVANNLSGKYILMNDIDLSGVEWQPIGKYDPTEKDPWAGAFKGEFNGNGFSIKNLTVAANENDTSVGLFGATDEAVITNVVLENANVSAPIDEYNEIAVGGLIGLSRNTNINNVSVSGNVSGHQGVGGLIGVIDDSHDFGKTTISNVNTDVNVNSVFYAGGLVGRVNDTQRNSLVIENCHTAGSVTVNDSCAGGLIGEAGKTVITVNNCSSSMNITKVSNSASELSYLLDSSRIGGIIGNCNGTYISICNSSFTGVLNAEDDFKGNNYGYYMNDAQISIFELSAGLPVDDILNIDGVESLTPVVDPQTGVAHYELTVSTLAGMNRIVDMIQDNPQLGDLITFNIQFDFESADQEYNSDTNYSQYGVVQHIYQDVEGKTINDVYIDNEIDLETTFNTAYAPIILTETEEAPPIPKRTMVDGLYKDAAGKYYVFTGGDTGGEYPGFKEVSLRFFFENKANITKRLEDDQVKIREKLTDIAQSYQINMQQALAEKYGYKLEDLKKFIIQEPEYKSLKAKEAKGEALTNDEKLKIELFELNYKIATMVGEITKNQGCGMGGDASFLEATTGIPLEDEWGRIRYMTIDGVELRQKVDDNGELMFNENGDPLFETLEGEDFEISASEAYIVRGYPITDEDGNFLYTDEAGATVIRKENEDGSYSYSYEDGTVYEDEEDKLTQQLEEQTPVGMVQELENELEALASELAGETVVEEDLAPEVTEEDKEKKEEEQV